MARKPPPSVIHKRNLRGCINYGMLPRGAEIEELIVQTKKRVSDLSMDELETLCYLGEGLPSAPPDYSPRR